jgi:hypothetical protein
MRAKIGITPLFAAFCAVILALSPTAFAQTDEDADDKEAAELDDDDGWDDDQDDAAAAAITAPAPPIGDDGKIDKEAALAGAGDGKKGTDAQRGFVKGELAGVGRTSLVSRYHRIGVGLGTTSFGKVQYARIDPIVELNFQRSGLNMAFGAPLNFFLVDRDETVDKAFSGAGELRKADWDNPSDYLQVIRLFQFGGKEQPFFLSLSQLDSSSIGHGGVMRRYAANLDVDRHRLSGQFDAYNDYGGFELYVNDVAAPEVLGMLTFIKPGRFIGDDRPLKRLSIGAHYTADLGAPKSLACSREVSFTTLKDPNGDPNDPEDQCVEAGQQGFFEVNEETKLPKVTTKDLVQFVGASIEFKPVRTESADLKPYFDFTQMIGHGSGMSVGLLGRFNVGRTKHSNFRIRAEGRTFDSNYIPSYFDILYEIDRYVSIQAVNAENEATTKLDYLERLQGGERRFGGYFEATYSLRNWFAVTTAWEQATAKASKSVLVHFEMPASKWLTLFLTYVKRNFDSFDSNPIDFRRSDVQEGIKTIPISDELFFWAFRIKILPFLALNWRAQRSFQIQGALPRYQGVFHYLANLELGYEF